MVKGVLVVSEEGVKAVRLDDKGREVPSSERPVIPLGFKKPESLNEMVQRFVRHAVSVQAQQAGFESFEDADDFDVDGDDVLPDTPYETEFDPLVGREVSKAELERHNREMKRHEREARYRAAHGVVTDGARRRNQRRKGERGAVDGSGAERKEAGLSGSASENGEVDGESKSGTKLK